MVRVFLTSPFKGGDVYVICGSKRINEEMWFDLQLGKVHNELVWFPFDHLSTSYTLQSSRPLFTYNST